MASFQLLGRAKEIKEFVKHGKDKAIVELELKGKNDRTVVIRREFGRNENKSFWFINGKKAIEGAVLEKVASLDVQLDNLM